jgi:hypothetical protein
MLNFVAVTNYVCLENLSKYDKINNVNTVYIPLLSALHKSYG